MSIPSPALFDDRTLDLLFRKSDSRPTVDTEPANGSLTIVGMGPARIEYLTLEAREILRRAEQENARVCAYGFSHAREIASQIAPGLTVLPLESVMLLNVSRAVLYDYIADMMVYQAFCKGLDVLLLVEGSPLVLNRSVIRIRELCAEKNYSVRLVHGMSFLELMFEQIPWSGSPGLQLYGARAILHGGIDLTTHSPVLLYQLGEFSDRAQVYDTARSVELLANLRDCLLTMYPAHHPVTILFSSGSPDYNSQARTIPLSDLALQPVPIYSNLWIPTLDGTR